MSKFKADEIKVGNKDLKEMMLDFAYPVGSYFITENKSFNTVAKVAAHFGGTWERVTDRMLYAVADDDVGVNDGSNTRTLSEANLPSHSHGFSGTTGSSAPENLTFSGVGVSGWFYIAKAGHWSNGGNAEGVFSRQEWGMGNNSGGSNPGTRINFNYTPSGAVYGGAHTHSFSGTTDNTGSATAINIVPANRHVYMYHRIG